MADVALRTEDIERLCEHTPYRAQRFLGRGGMGQVWVVRHEFLGSDFALKILHPRFGTRPHVIDRLRLEAQLTAMLDHPNVVPVVDFWVATEGQACLVMELLTGRTLGAELKERRQLPVNEALELGVQLLSGLGAAHQQGVIHRDVKPDNIFLHDLPGIPRRARLLDFGLARAMKDSGDFSVAPAMQPTRTGAVLGTPRYRSPEATRGESLDRRTDIYSVGVILYEALTDRGPFDFISQQAAPAVPSSLVGSIPTACDNALLRALSFNPAERYQDVADFEAALRPLLPSRPHRTSIW